MRRRRLAPRDALRRLPARLRVAALAQAILHTPPPETPELVLMLLDDAHTPAPGAPLPRVLERVRTGLDAPRRRAAEDALAALAAGWTRVPADLRSAALAVGKGRWTSAIARAAQSDDPGVRQSAAELIRESGDLRSARTAASLLLDEDRDVSRAADSALLTLALISTGFAPGMLGEELERRRGPERVGASPELALGVAHCIAECAWVYGEGHRGRDTLLAALLLAPCSDGAHAPSPAHERLGALLESRDHDAVGALRTLIRTTTSPEMRARAWRWLGGGPMAAASLERVSKAHTDEEHAGVLRAAHLALRPARLAALNAVGVRVRPGSPALAEGGVLPTPGFWARLDPTARRGTVMLTERMGLPRPSRRAALAPALGDPDALVRHRAARACDPMDVPDFTLDPDARVARTAALRWSTVGLPGSARRPRHAGDERRERLVRRLARARHPGVRHVVQEDTARTDAWDARSALSRQVARRWLAEDGAGFVAAARERLRDPDEGMRVGAVQLLHTVRCAGRLERELVEALAADRYPRAAATAARALGSVRTPGSREALARATHAGDARVRANALESLARLDTGAAHAAAFVECKGDRHHRVRASAVRALLESSAATPGEDPLADVRAMLDDARAEHRLAGVWVAERVLGGLAAAAGTPAQERVMQRLTELATGDASAEVRARAARCVRRVLVEASYAVQGATAGGAA